MSGGVWIIGEVAPDGSLTRLSAEVATLARGLGEGAGRPVVGVVVGADPVAAAGELARYVARVVAVTEPAIAGHAAATIVAERVAALISSEAPDLVLFGASPDGRDAAGVVSALTGLGVLANAVAVDWIDGQPTIDMSVFGGALFTTSGFTAGRGLATVRPNVVTAEPAASTGVVEPITPEAPLSLPLVSVLGHVEEAGARVSIEEAAIVVVGGRGVGSQDGFALVEELADALGGVVGATRAAVDSGWINYASQIGQTGKTVKPQLYLGLGVSGAIQHKVGMQTAETIVAINRDPDAPLAEFADLYVVGDLFDVVPALIAQIRARRD
jgi:electron transfer flavoprotein alpha subunit